MEQEEAIESLLCETPSLLPTLSLSLATSEGPQTSEGSALAPAATSVQVTVNQSKAIKVRNDG